MPVQIDGSDLLPFEPLADVANPVTHVTNVAD